MVLHFAYCWYLRAHSDVNWAVNMVVIQAVMVVGDGVGVCIDMAVYISWGVILVNVVTHYDVDYVANVEFSGAYFGELWCGLQGEECHNHYLQKVHCVVYGTPMHHLMVIFMLYITVHGLHVQIFIWQMSVICWLNVNIVKLSIMVKICFKLNVEMVLWWLMCGVMLVWWVFTIF